MKPFHSLAPLCAVLLLLGACTIRDSGKTVYSGSPLPVEPVVEEPVPSGPDPFLQARLLADLLYDAKLAYDDNRLMSPEGNNAYERYQQALEMDPGNTVALEGIQALVLRYVELADNAIRQGKYAEADSLLGRAARLNPERPELIAASERLEQARHTRIETFALDPAGLSSQSLEMLTQLGEIAQHIMQQEATFLINARTDEEGRWIYRVMREAVGGYRLRGNLEISSTPNVLVTLPAE